MDADKLARATSRELNADVRHAVQVRFGMPLNNYGLVAAIAALGMVGATISSMTPSIGLGLLPAAVVMLGFWLIRRFDVYGEAIIGRTNEEIVVVNASMMQARPIRGLRKTYPPNTVVGFEQGDKWWEAGRLVIGEDTWHVAPPFEQVASQWYRQ